MRFTAHDGTARRLFAAIRGAFRWRAPRYAEPPLLAAYPPNAQYPIPNTDPERLCIAALEAVAYALEARNPYNVGHLARLQQDALRLAEALRLPPEEKQALRVAALLHDIGWLGVPDYLLHKRDSLTEDEQARVRAYPVIGAQILADVPFPWPVIPIVRHHQERYDGSGYPDGLKGEEVPLGARILAVADAYDSLILDRPHRPGWTHDAALAHLEDMAGAALDPEIVAVFCRLMNAGRAVREEEFAIGAHCEITHAHREMRARFELSQALSATLNLERIATEVVERVREMTGASTCALFLLEPRGEEKGRRGGEAGGGMRRRGAERDSLIPDEEYLRAHAVSGVNARPLLGSYARLGTYITGRVASRNQPICASYIPGDLSLRHVSTSWTTLRSTLVAPLWEDGRPVGTINLYHEEPDAFTPDTLRLARLAADVTAGAVRNSLLFRQMQESAFTDPLTGLRNSRYLRQFLDQELNRARKRHHGLAVMLLDLDNFKPINDVFGHERGDRVLKEAAAIFAANVRNYDLAARYAGDEFVIVLPESGRAEAESVAQKIKEALAIYSERMRRAEGPNFPNVGSSIGVACYPEDGADIAALLSHADAAMYRDKRTFGETRRVA